jgi:hypothetical protein
VAGLFPLLELEPPAEYVRFVEAHLEPLRYDARRLAGDGLDAEALCSGVLVDIALRWWWFELLREWFRRPDPAGGYLGAALGRRVARLYGEPGSGAGSGSGDVVIEVWSDAGRYTAPTGADIYPDREWALVAAAPPPARLSKAGPSATSAAVRIAAVRPAPALAVPAATDAVIGWLHAHETYVRYRLIVEAVVALVVLAVLVELRSLP